MTFRERLGRSTAMLRFAQRIRTSQILARARLRWRRGMLTRRGLEPSVQRSRTSLAKDWQVRLAHWPVELRVESPWQVLPASRFKASCHWLELGPQANRRYNSELYRLQLFCHQFLVDHHLPRADALAFLADYLQEHRLRGSDTAYEWSPYAVTGSAGQLAALPGRLRGDDAAGLGDPAR